MMRWFRAWTKDSSPGKARSPEAGKRRLTIEPLEDRVTPSSISDIWTARYDAQAAKVKADTQWSYSSDSATLAWSESYVLSSFLAAHSASGDAGYLTQFAEHADRILDNAGDKNDDGFLGWGTFNYSQNLARNGSFEIDASFDDSLPAGWVRYQSTEKTAYRDPFQYRHGLTSVTLRTNPIAGWQILQTPLYNPLVRDNRGYEPDTLYQLSFYGRTNGSKAGGRAEVYDYTTGKMLTSVSFRHSNWQAHAVTFRTPAQGGHNIQVRLLHVDYKVAGGTASFDFVRVRQYAEFAVHGGMITAPMVQFAAMVKNSPDLQATYGAIADRYADFVREEIVPRWDPYFRAVGANRGTYVFPDDGSTVIPRNSLPHNHYLALGRAIVWLSQVDESPALEERAAKLANMFKSKLKVVSGGAFVWHYTDRLLSGDYNPNRAAEDVSHANVDVGFAVAAQQAGIVFTTTDIRRFATTLTRTMWNKSYSSPKIRFRVDGTGGFSRPTTMGEWTALAAEDGRSKAWGIVSAMFAHNRRWSKAGPSGLLTMARLAERAPEPLASTDPAVKPTGGQVVKNVPVAPPPILSPILQPIWVGDGPPPRGVR
jgi:hypothetical protein